MKLTPRTGLAHLKAIKNCSICRKPYRGWGHSAWPINDKRCCDECAPRVIAARIALYRQHEAEEQKK